MAKWKYIKDDDGDEALMNRLKVICDDLKQDLIVREAAAYAMGLDQEGRRIFIRMLNCCDAYKLEGPNFWILPKFMPVTIDGNGLTSSGKRIPIGAIWDEALKRKENKMGNDK